MAGMEEKISLEPCGTKSMAGMEEKISLEPSITKSMAGYEGFSPKPSTAQAAAADEEEDEEVDVEVVEEEEEEDEDEEVDVEVVEEEAFAGEEAFKGCGSKRKVEEDGPYQKEEAVVVIREQNQGVDEMTYELQVWGDGNDYDSDDDVKTVIAKAEARFYAVIEENKRLLKYPGYTADEGDSVHVGDDGAVVDVGVGRKTDDRRPKPK